MICTECKRTIVGSETCPLCNAETSMPDMPEVVVKGFTNRPGTALASIIPKWAAKQRNGCSCKDYQKKMDLWGTDGCEKMFDNIVDHLSGQKSELAYPFNKLPDALIRQGAKSLVRRAIDMSLKQ